ncbi:centrosomal protein of 76 kDa isoform X2 [Anabrus simplex]|uniref:centrosomal protein of 76 kDa isoform X2 n=1 Tax=Anabrus simplex TaxID=316456 RepID=UPI0035A381D8
MSSENLTKEAIPKKRSKEELQQLIRVCLEEIDVRALVLQMINNLQENRGLINQKEVQKEIVRKLKQNGVLRNLLENVRSRISHQEVVGTGTSTGDRVQNNPEETRAQRGAETSTCRCKMVYPECTTSGPASSSEHQKSSPESEYSSHERLEQSKNLQTSDTPTVTRMVNPRRRYLHFEICKMTGFLQRITKPSEKTPFMFYVCFRKQRYWTKPAPIASFADFKTGFLLELHSDEMGPFRRATGDELLRMNDRIHLVLVKVLALGYKHVVSSTFIEWRYVLAEKESQGKWSVDLRGVGAESKTSLGNLQLHFTLIPALPEPIAVVPYLKIEDAQYMEQHMVFLAYTKDWWAEFLSMRPSHKQRFIKIFCQDENSSIRSVFHYVRPLEVGRPILETPREAAWFVSLIELEDQAIMELPFMEEWWNPHTFLVLKRGTVEHHAFLLCSLLLGFGMDAYVCTGTNGPHPWMWVLTVGGQKSSVIFWESTTGARYSHVNPTGTSDDPPTENLAYPYSKIGCIFNDKHFYANIQERDWVPMCKFHLEDSRQWKAMSPAAIQSLVGNEQGIPLQPGLLDPIMYSQDMERELRQLISEYRLDHQLRTRWNMELYQLLAPVLASCEMEHKCGVKLAREEIRELMNSVLHPDNTVKAVPIHVPAKNARNKWVKEVLHIDNIDSEFAVKVNAYVYPENIFSVWLVIGCTFKDS